MKRVLRTISKNWGIPAVRKRYRKVQAIKEKSFENTELVILEKDHMGLPALTIVTNKEFLYYRVQFVARKSREVSLLDQDHLKEKTSQGLEYKVKVGGK
jgi:hypothetical protein